MFLYQGHIGQMSVIRKKLLQSHELLMDSSDLGLYFNAPISIFIGIRQSCIPVLRHVSVVVCSSCVQTFGSKLEKEGHQIIAELLTTG